VDQPIRERFKVNRSYGPTLVNRARNVPLQHVHHHILDRLRNLTVRFHDMNSGVRFLQPRAIIMPCEEELDTFRLAVALLLVQNGLLEIVYVLSHLKIHTPHVPEPSYDVGDSFHLRTVNRSL